MATDSIRLTTVIAADPERIYRAWLDAGEHGAFTGGTASIEAWVGGRLTAWDGYIEGRNLELDAPRRIVQSWRTTEFPDGSADSRLELSFAAVSGGTEITLIHTEIPEGQGEKYRLGWVDYYFESMKSYFGAKSEAAPAAPAKSAAARPKSSKPKAAAKPAMKKPAAKKVAKQKPAAKKVVKKKALKKSAAKKKAGKRVAKRRVAAKSKKPAAARKSARPAKRKAARRPAKRVAKKAARRVAKSAKRKPARRVARRPGRRR